MSIVVSRRILASTPVAPGDLDNIVFTRGVPRSVDMSPSMPANAVRTQGGWYGANNSLSHLTDNHGGVVRYYADSRALSYGGGNPNADGYSRNPNPDYWVGYEVPPFNTHWQWPPTTIVLPNKSGATTYPKSHQKHVRYRFCTWDQKIHAFGGDYTSYPPYGLNEGSNGRTLMWKWDVVPNTWELDYTPAAGRVGEVVPLGPDLMGFTWDPDQQIWWIMFGGVSGVQSEAIWKSLGGLADTWPKSAASQVITDYPVFTFDPKLAVPKYALTGATTPWVPPRVQECVYYSGTRRVYAIDTQNDALRIRWLQTTNTPPTWSYLDISMTAGPPGNLTGTNKYASAGMNQFGLSPLKADEAGKQILFLSLVKYPAVLALTMQGHPLGEHRVIEIAPLPGATGLLGDDSGVAAAGSTAFEFIPELRKAVVIMGWTKEQIGPTTSSHTIDIDTGVVTEGPRHPNRPGTNTPWFTDNAVWHPPTQQLILLGHVTNDYARPYQLDLQNAHAYTWSP